MKKNLQWDNYADTDLESGDYMICKATIYGKEFSALKFNTGAAVCPIFDPKTGETIFVERFNGANYVLTGRVVGVPTDNLMLVKITALRNAGFTVNFANNQVYITDKSGQLYSPGYQLLGYSLPNQA